LPLKVGNALEFGKMDDTKPEPVRGTPESAAWFRAALEDLGETKASMARLMKRKGDDRQPDTIERHMRRMATGEARVSGEMRVILTMMRRARDRSLKRAAAENVEAANSLIRTNQDREAGVFPVKLSPDGAKYDRSEAVAPGVSVEFDAVG
jgi:hypothetical protein